MAQMAQMDIDPPRMEPIPRWGTSRSAMSLVIHLCEFAKSVDSRKFLRHLRHLWFKFF